MQDVHTHDAKNWPCQERFKNHPASYHDGVVVASCKVDCAPDCSTAAFKWIAVVTVPGLLHRMQPAAAFGEKIGTQYDSSRRHHFRSSCLQQALPAPHQSQKPPALAQCHEVV